MQRACGKNNENEMNIENKFQDRLVLPSDKHTTIDILM